MTRGTVVVKLEPTIQNGQSVSRVQPPWTGKRRRGLLVSATTWTETWQVPTSLTGRELWGLLGVPKPKNLGIAG